MAGEICQKVFKATNRGSQQYSDTIMQTVLYIGTSLYFNNKSITHFNEKRQPLGPELGVQVQYFCPVGGLKFLYFGF